MQYEVWKEVKGFEGLYEISTLGKVKSLPRLVNNAHANYLTKERILRCSLDGFGYLKVGLCRNGKNKTIKVHVLMAIAFLNHTPNGHKIAIDHINGIKTCNNIENLRVVTQRFNCSIGERKDRGMLSSQYSGVYWNKNANMWHSRIEIAGKSKHLGYFKNEIDAANAYLNAVISLS